MAKRVGTAEFEAEVLKEKLPVIVEFYSDSCIPCKQLSPILGGIEDDYEDQVKVVKVNVNFDADLAGEYQVMASPTILFFKDGREVDRIRGLVKRPELVEWIALHLNFVLAHAEKFCRTADDTGEKTIFFAW